MEILLYLGILALVLLSAGAIYFVSMMPNQKSFDEVKEEQKKKIDLEKKAALHEAKERALRAKEKKRQKKAAAKEDKRLNSLSAESEGAADDVPNEPLVKKVGIIFYGKQGWNIFKPNMLVVFLNPEFFL